MTPKVRVTYAQHKSGLKLHLVPELGGDSVANVALCGYRVNRWRMVINVPLAHACHNCIRVNNRRGCQRALEIIKSVWSNT